MQRGKKPPIYVDANIKIHDHQHPHTYKTNTSIEKHTSKKNINTQKHLDCQKKTHRCIYKPLKPDTHKHT